jgi:DNA-binding transcriptional MerR regulator
MSTIDALREIWTEARPYVEQQLQVAEVIKGFREAATAKGLEWSSVKALIKAQIQDEQDGGKRVQKLIEKAEFATAYADMLGLNLNEENKIGRAA